MTREEFKALRDKYNNEVASRDCRLCKYNRSDRCRECYGGGFCHKLTLEEYILEEIGLRFEKMYYEEESTRKRNKEIEECQAKLKALRDEEYEARERYISEHELRAKRDILTFRLEDLEAEEK